jgi:hypothetical protein
MDAPRLSAGSAPGLVYAFFGIVRLVRLHYTGVVYVSPYSRRNFTGKVQAALKFCN